MNWYSILKFAKCVTNKSSFPFEDPVVVVKVKGHAIRSALENGVSTYPALEGRFPQVAGLQYVFDPRLAPGKRLLNVTMNGKELDANQDVTLATRDYMCRGKGNLIYARLGLW